MRNFINLLTFSRIFTGPIILILILFYTNYIFAFILFLVISITDYFDGFLARKYKLESEMGAILDPIADKILITFLLLAIAVELNSFFVALMAGLILSREFWVSALRQLSSSNDGVNVTKVTFQAKIKTSLQFLSICSYLIGLMRGNSLIIFTSDFLLLASTILTIKTGWNYTTAIYSTKFNEGEEN